MKDPLPNRRRVDPSSWHPYRAHDGNGLRHPHHLCITCGGRRNNYLHSQHEPQDTYGS
jgi:hypothetical protein